MGNPTEKNAGHNQQLQQVKGIVDDGPRFSQLDFP
jgi:hypothetical protein